MNRVEIEVITEKLGGILKADMDEKERKVEIKESLSIALEIMESKKYLYPCASISSSNKLLAFIVFPVKRVISKMLYWYIKPICDAQEQFNMSVCDCLRLMAEELSEKNENR